MDLKPIVLLVCAFALASTVRASEIASTRDQGFNRTAFWIMKHDSSDAEIKARAKALALTGIDGVILGGGGHHYLHNDLPNIEQYVATARRIVDACHAHGIRVAEHHSVVLTSDKAYAESHREWLQCDFETGKPSIWPEYQTYAFCPNNPDFREHYWKLAKDIMLRTGMDALMSDDTVFHHGCCCAACARRWKDEVGGDIREAFKDSRKSGTREWRRFNEVRRQWYADFRAWVRGRQRSQMPEKQCIALLGSILCAWGTQTHGGAIEGGLDTSDIGIWEVYNPADFFSWRRLSAEAAALAEAARARGCVPVCFPYADTVQKRDEYDPEEELFVWGLARAHGMRFGLGRVFLNGPVETDPPRGYFQFERDRLAPYLASEPAGTIGIMFSGCSRDSDPAWESFHSRAAIAWAEVLLDDCIPWRAVTEETLDSGLPRGLRTLILPNVFAMSDKHLDTIERFVRGGGVVVASFLPAVCDETGEPVLDSRRERLAGLLGVRLKSAELKDAPAEFETMTASRFREEPEVYANRAGKGMVYYAPELLERKVFLDWINEGMIYNDTRDRALSQTLAGMLLDLTPDQPVRITRSDPGAHILTTVRRLGNRLLVFVVNSAGADLSNGRVVPLPSKVIWSLPVDLRLEFAKTPRSVKVVSVDGSDERVISSPGKALTLRCPKRFGVIVADF